MAGSDLLRCRFHFVIGAGEGMAMLAFDSPSAPFADERFVLFEAAASTLEFVTA